MSSGIITLPRLKKEMLPYYLFQASSGLISLSLNGMEGSTEKCCGASLCFLFRIMSLQVF
jgi:hypothetical protein